MGSTVNRIALTGGASARAWPQMAKPRMAANKLRCIFVPSSDEAPPAYAESRPVANAGRWLGDFMVAWLRSLGANRSAMYLARQPGCSGVPWFPLYSYASGKDRRGRLAMTRANEAMAPESIDGRAAESSGGSDL